MIIRQSFWTRMSVAGAHISLLFAVVSVTSGIVAIVFGGFVFVPFVLTNLSMTMPMAIIDLLLIYFLSPDRDMLHYPHAVAAAFRRYKAGRRGGAAKRSTDDVPGAMQLPQREAWRTLLAPRTMLDEAKIAHRRALKTRAETMSARLSGSIDLLDVEAKVLLDGTVVDLAKAYAAAMDLAPPIEQAMRLHDEVDATLVTIVKAAETRRSIAEAAVSDQLQAAMLHARTSAARIEGRTDDSGWIKDVEPDRPTWP